MKRLLIALALLLPACPHPKPPVPTPTPPPVGPEFPNLVLKRGGAVGGTLQYASGMEFPFRETIACCVGAQGTGWPDINKQTIDQYIQVGRVTVIHLRVGPFSGLNESEYATLGGGYVQQGARVDLNTFNTGYWQQMQDTVRYANQHGIVAELVPVDDWVLKTVVYGDGAGVPYPWHPSGNVQSEDSQSQAPGPRQEQWIRHVVQTFWTLGVVWQLGNEEKQNTGYDFAAVTLARAKIVRDEEDKLGSPHHLLSTNCDCDPALVAPELDWYIVHNGLPREVIPDRVISNNEYNPSVPASCAEARSQWCKAKAYGGYYAAWRHEMTDADWTCFQGTISEGGACSAWEAQGCEVNEAAADAISCKKFSGSLFDCTPKRGGQPIKSEGTINRPDCEFLAMGQSYPDYSLADVTGNLSLNVRGNPMQFVAKGSGRGRLVCTIPSRGSANVCRSSTGGPLWIEQ